MIWFWFCVFFPFAAAHLQGKGLDDGDASRLASAFGKMGINDSGAIDVSGWRLGLARVKCQQPTSSSCGQQARLFAVQLRCLLE